jgi:hypothetical protein
MEIGRRELKAHYLLPLAGSNNIKMRVCRMNETQLALTKAYANKIQSSNTEAAGVALLVLDCGCIRAAPFNQAGDPAGGVALLRVIIGDKRRSCQRCQKDKGNNPARVQESTVLWFEPCPLSKKERKLTGRKILGGACSHQ